MNYFEPDLYDPQQAVKIVTQTATILNGTIIKGFGNPFNGWSRKAAAACRSAACKHRYNNWCAALRLRLRSVRRRQDVHPRGRRRLLRAHPAERLSTSAAWEIPRWSTPRVLRRQHRRYLAVAWSPAAPFRRSPSSPSTPRARSRRSTPGRFDVQRKLGPPTSLDIGYVGNCGRHQHVQSRPGPVAAEHDNRPRNTTILTHVNNTTNAVRPVPRLHQCQFHRVRRHQQLQRAADAPDAGASATHLTMNVSFRVVQGDGRSRFRRNAPSATISTAAAITPGGLRPHQGLQLRLRVRTSRLSPKIQQHIAKRVVNGWQLAGIHPLLERPPAQRFGQRRPRHARAADSAPTTSAARSRPPLATRFNYFNPLAFGRPGMVRSAAWAATSSPARHQPVGYLVVQEHDDHRACARTVPRRDFNTFNHTQWAGVNAGISVRQSRARRLPPARQGPPGRYLYPRSA